MHADRDNARPAPLFTPARSAGAVAIFLLIALIGYLIAFGGAWKLLATLGFTRSAATGTSGPNTPSPLNIAGRELGELKQATLGAYNALGELPPPEALADTEGVPKIDPWGNPYRYHRTPDNRQFWFSSDGPDGKPDTPDDISTSKVP